MAVNIIHSSTRPFLLLFFVLSLIILNPILSWTVPLHHFARCRNNNNPSSLSSSQHYQQRQSSDGIYRSNQDPAVANSNRLSHAMFKVNNVNASVNYWKKHFGATVLRGVKQVVDEHGYESYRSAFVALGNGTDVSEKQSFALELVETKEDMNLGTALCYIGISRLFQFQKGNWQTIATNPPSPLTNDIPTEPNQLPIQWATSSPGDYICRIVLKTNDIQATLHFYETILGMQVAAADDSMVCLRYHPVQGGGGVPTTLVLEGTNEPLQHGTCLDHFVIRTTANIEEEYARLLESDFKASIFMKPTTMFDSMVMGVKDPNGYKVVIAEEIV